MVRLKTSVQICHFWACFFFFFFLNYPFRHSSFTSCCRWEKAKPLHCNSFYSLNTQFQCILYKVAAICTILCHQAFMIIPAQKVEGQFSGGCHQWMSWPHHSVACYNRVCNLLCFFLRIWGRGTCWAFICQYVLSCLFFFFFGQWCTSRTIWSAWLRVWKNSAACRSSRAVLVLRQQHRLVSNCAAALL